MANEKKIYSLDEFMNASFPSGEIIVEGLLRTQELQLLVATAKTGKSYLAINLALQVARGLPFLTEFPTRRSRVLIWQTEIAGARMRERLDGMFSKCGYGDIGESVHIILERQKFSTSEGLSYLKGVINSIKPDLLILDPLYTLHDLDENSSKDMAPFLTNLREVMIENNLACLLVHHQGKRGEKSSNRQTGHQSRGSSSIADVPDGTWSLDRRDLTGTAILSFELRNHKAPSAIQLTLSDNWWKSLGSVHHESLTVGAVVSAIAVQPEIKKTQLIVSLRQKYNVSQRTVESRIKSALEQRLVVEQRNGREKTYCQAKEETPQPL